MIAALPPRRAVGAFLAAAVLAGCGGSARPSAHPRRLVLGPVGGGANAALYPERPTTYVLGGSLPDLGARGPVFDLAPASPDESQVRRIAGRLGVDGPVARTVFGFEVHTSDGSVEVMTGSGTTTVSYNRGEPQVAAGGSGISGSSGTAVAVPPSPPPEPPPTPEPSPSSVPEPSPPSLPQPVDVPDDAGATRIASDLLDGMGVLEGGTWRSEVTEAGGVAVACPQGVECNAPPPVVTARTVTFHRVVDAIDVRGADWSVTIGEHRRVQSVYGTWASVEPVADYPLRSTRAVFDDLQHGRAVLPGPRPLGGAENLAPTPITVTITGATRGLVVWPGTHADRPVVYLLPAYRFRAQVAGGTPYEIEVLALDPSAFETSTSTSSPAPTGTSPPGTKPQPVPQPAPEVSVSQ